MAKLFATIKAILTRLVFASHGFIAIWQVTNFKKNPYYWYLCCPIVLLFFEGIFTLTIKKNQEWKWFCPSVFLYLSSVVPAIWLLELDKVDKKIQMQESNINNTETIDLGHLAADDLQKVKEKLGVDIKLPEIKISTDTWVKLIEQFLMLILIIGRWLLPKGELTRDQLSQLLLVYIGTAADIIEFFDAFKEDKIAREPVLVYLTLGIWAWSLVQFTVVLTATKSRKSRLSSGGAIRKRISTETSCCSIDVWGIALNMLLQDGPFLAFRLILIIQYKILNYMNIFFTCKNTLVILLQLYRLYVVQTENRYKRREEMYERYEKFEIPNISIISRNDKHGGRKERDYREERRKNRIREKDLEEELSSNSEDSENIDEYQSSPRELERRKRKSKRDFNYITHLSKADRHKSRGIDCKEKSLRKNVVSSGEEDTTRMKMRKERGRKENKGIYIVSKEVKKGAGRSKKVRIDVDEVASSPDFEKSKSSSEGSETDFEKRRRCRHKSKRHGRD